MHSRRELIMAGACAASLSPMNGAAAETLSPEGAKLNALFDDFFREGLRRSPEGATQLGLDKGPNADLKSKLSDESSAGIAAGRALTLSQFNRLKTINRAALTAAEKVNYDTVYYTRDTGVRVAKFDFGGGGFGPGPYVVSQLTGSYQSTPDFLDTKHRIENAADADAYMARLSAFAVQLDQNTDRQKHDAALGVIPPDFILDLTLEQLTALRVPADQSVLVKSIARRAAAKGLGDSYAANASLIYNEQIAPALDRQIAETKRLRAVATHEAGVWARHDGEGFYLAALRATTTTSLTPAEIHKLGLEQAAEISARIDGLLKGQGMTKGTVGERMKALAADSTYFFPNTDAGKVDAIAYCNGRLDAIRPRLPRFFKRLPPYSFEVRRVPPQTEAGAANAFSQGPAIDGSRPGLVYINLRDSADWPKWSLPTVTFHEGLPGHQLEGGLALSNTNLPLIRKTMGFSGYAEGWALYAEQLADELGMYDDDPLGRIGFLRGQLFRANRCVVDTGIHHLHWSREQAVAYFVEHEGDAAGYITREVDRYCAQPGQACSYKLGHTAFVTGRARAKAKLGARFDIKDYHGAVLNCGRVPLDVLNGVIDAYMAG
jgi:uncharacterized protein (DUF885 family)